jgi:hypothetical protein
VIFYNDDPTKFPAECADDTCIRVDVYRTNRTIDGITRTNPLPMMFGQLVGLAEQGVRATATAQIYAGNAAKCVKPWVVADRWNEGNAPPVDWTQSSEFNLEGEPDPDEDPDQEDTYSQATYVDEVYTPGTGFGATWEDGTLKDYGYQFILRMANPGGGSGLGVRSPGWVMTVDLPNDTGTSGLPSVLWNIYDCTTALVAIADPSDPCDEASSSDPADYDGGQIVITCIGVQTGNAWVPQEGALEDWLGDDITDKWNPDLNDGQGGPADENGVSKSSSKRIIPLAIFDPQHYASHGWNGTNGVVRVVNVLGFFIEGTCGGGTPLDEDPFDHELYLSCSSSGPANDLVGRLVTIVGEAVGGGGEVGPASFTKVIRLIR